MSWLEGIGFRVIIIRALKSWVRVGEGGRDAF